METGGRCWAVGALACACNKDAHGPGLNPFVRTLHPTPHGSIGFGHFKGGAAPYSPPPRGRGETSTLSGQGVSEGRQWGWLPTSLGAR